MRSIEGGRNWTQRLIIRTELGQWQPQESPPGKPEISDPLALVKQHYWRMYAGQMDARASAQPDILPGTMPNSADTFALISNLVDGTAVQLKDLHDKHRKRLEDFPSGIRQDVEQFLNVVIVELAHGAEDKLEATIKGLAQDDPLLRLGIIGRIIRRVFPSPQERVRRKISALTIQRINAASQQFLTMMNKKIG